jgi:urease accessory protein
MTLRVALLLIVAGTPAQAHGALPGGGGFYAGALHPFVSPDHLVALIAVGFVLSLRDQRAGLGVLVAGVGVGLALPFAGITFVAAGLPLLIIAMVVGGSLALARPMPAMAVLTISLGTGLCIGLQTDVPITTWLIAASAGMGVFVAVFLIAAYAMAIGTVTAGWLNGLPRRIAGSWIVAITLMMLAFMARGMLGIAP